MEEITKSNYSKSTAATFSTVKPVSVTDAINNASRMSSLGGNRIDPKYIATGNYYGQQKLGGDKVQIDSSGGRIIISDDTNKQRFLAGARS